MDTSRVRVIGIIGTNNRLKLSSFVDSKNISHFGGRFSSTRKAFRASRVESLRFGFGVSASRRFCSCCGSALACGGAPFANSSRSAAIRSSTRITRSISKRTYSVSGSASGRKLTTTSSPFSNCLSHLVHSRRSLTSGAMALSCSAAARNCVAQRGNCGSVLGVQDLMDARLDFWPVNADARI